MCIANALAGSIGITNADEQSRFSGREVPVLWERSTGSPGEKYRFSGREVPFLWI